MLPPFPATWTIEELDAVVSDTNGEKLAHVYFEDEPGRQSVAKLSYAALLPLALTRLVQPEAP